MLRAVVGDAQRHEQSSRRRISQPGIAIEVDALRRGKVRQVAIVLVMSKVICHK